MHGSKEPTGDIVHGKLYSRANAWGHDELAVFAGGKRGVRNWLHMQGTLIDALDTLHVMGLMEEFEAAVKMVETKLNFASTDRTKISVGGVGPYVAQPMP